MRIEKFFPPWQAAAVAAKQQIGKRRGQISRVEIFHFIDGDATQWDYFV